MTRPEPLLSFSDYAEDIKVRWEIHQYEVSKLTDDVKQLFKFVKTKVSILTDSTYFDAIGMWWLEGKHSKRGRQTVLHPLFFIQQNIMNISKISNNQVYLSEMLGAAYTLMDGDDGPDLFVSPMFVDGTYDDEEDCWIMVDHMALLGEEESIRNEINRIDELLVTSKVSL